MSQSSLWLGLSDGGGKAVAPFVSAIQVMLWWVMFYSSLQCFLSWLPINVELFLCFTVLKLVQPFVPRSGAFCLMLKCLNEFAVELSIFSDVGTWLWSAALGKIWLVLILLLLKNRHAVSASADEANRYCWKTPNLSF